MQPMVGCTGEYNLGSFIMSTFFQAVHQSVGHFLADEEGVTAIEYGLIAALIAVASVAAVTLLSTELKTIFLKVCGQLRSPAVATC
jgi:pilus assembly protein Flp/PilA